MSTLRNEVIQRVYDECADFAERHGVSEEAACLFATKVGTFLRYYDEWGIWTREEKRHPSFILMANGAVQTGFMNEMPEQVLVYRA